MPEHRPNADYESCEVGACDWVCSTHSINEVVSGDPGADGTMPAECGPETISESRMGLSPCECGAEGTAGVYAYVTDKDATYHEISDGVWYESVHDPVTSTLLPGG